MEKEEKKKINSQVIVAAVESEPVSISPASKYVRDKYVDSKKMDAVKLNAYKKEDGTLSKTIVDEGNGLVLHRSKVAAQKKYGKKASVSHWSETDHSVPLKNIYDRHSGSAWLTDKDIKNAANNTHNLKEISAKVNRQKKEITNLEYIRNNRKNLSKEEIAKLTKDHIEGRVYTETQLAAAKVKNIAGTAVEGAKESLIAVAPALIHQSTKDIAKVIEGDMDVEEAAKDIGISLGTSMVAGVVTKVVGHQVEHAANKISQKVFNKTLDSNIVGKVLGMALSLKDCTESFLNGEIDAKEYLCEVLEDGVGYIINTIGYAIGELFGGPFGGACVSYVLGEVYGNIVSACRDERLSRHRREELERLANRIKKEQEEYRNRFKEFFLEFYQNRENELDKAFNSIMQSLSENNTELFMNSINSVAEAYGVEKAWTVEEMDEKMNDDDYVFSF